MYAPKGASEIKEVTAALNSLRKKCLSRRSRTSAAKAGTENRPFIAAVNRCATQNQMQHRVFSQAVKAMP
jgi:capsule polysaccharide export protein KpsE/RkpR